MAEATPRILQASAGHTIEVVGGNLVSDKMFNIAAMLLTADNYFGEYQINKLTFAENEPAGKFGTYCFETKEIALNLQGHFDEAVDGVMSKNEDIHAKYLSFHANIWYSLILTLLHEGFHGIIWDTEPAKCEKAKINKNLQNEIENDCTSHAEKLSFDLFRDYDMEPEAINQEPFFGFRFMKFFIDNIKDGDSDWAARQNIMVESDLVYYDEEDHDGIPTMREWLRNCEEGDPDKTDERWEKKPITIPNIMVNPGVMVMKTMEAGATEAVATITKEVQVRQPVQAEPAMVMGDFAQAPDDAVMSEIMDATMANAVVMEMEDSPFHDDVGDYVQAEMEGVVAKAAEAVKIADTKYAETSAWAAGWAAEDDSPLPNGESLLDEAMDEMMAPELAEMKTVLATQQPMPAPEPTKFEYIRDNVCKACNKFQPIGSKFCNNCGISMAEEVKTACVFGKEVKLQPFGANVIPTPAPASEFIQSTTQPTTSKPVQQSEFITPTGGNEKRKFTQSLRNDLPNISMNVVDMKRILEEVYKRMHEHCFTKCGFQLSGVNTGNASAWNEGYAGNILEPINIADIPGATQLIIAIDRYNNATGKITMNSSITDGTISGKITKTDEPIPSYAVYINNNGVEQKRLFLVQRAFKMTANGYSQNSIKAQQGNQISWVLDGADRRPGEKAKYIYKVENGIAEWL